MNEFVSDQWFSEIVDYHLINEYVNQIDEFINHFFFDEVSWMSMCLVRAWNWEFLIKAMTSWLSSYIIIAWKYSTSHVNWIMRFRNQIIFFATTICSVYSTSQMNSVTINWRFENQLMTLLLTLKAYSKINRLMSWSSAQFEFV